jgi:hypothetical protein
LKTKKITTTLLLTVLVLSVFISCSSDNRVEQGTTNSPEDNPQYKYNEFDYSNNSHRNQIIRYPNRRTRCIGQRIAINKDQLCRNLQLEFQNNFYNRRNRRDYFDKNCGDRAWNPDRVRSDFYSQRNLIACTVSGNKIHLSNFNMNFNFRISFNSFSANNYFNDLNFNNCHPTDRMSQILGNDILVLEQWNRIVVIKRLDQNSSPRISISIYEKNGTFVGEQITILKNSNYAQTFYDNSGTYVTCFKIPSNRNWYYNYQHLY